MLKLILGGVNSDKNDLFTNAVIDEVKNKSDILVIVPDQYSFEFDKELYGVLGPRAFNQIEVIAFNRLCEKLLKLYGGQSGDFADQNARLVCMYLAVCEFKKKGSAAYYSKALSKVGFCADLISVVDDLRLSGVTTEMLREKGFGIGGTLGDKTQDISDISELYYSQLEKRGLKDNSTVVGEAVKAARESLYFNNKTVFIHEFSDFSYDEYRLISVILSQAKCITVSLIEDDFEKERYGLSPFSSTTKTRSKLISKAREMGQEVSVRKACDSRFESRAVEFVSKHIFRFGKHSYTDENDGVEVVCAKTPYDETEYVAARIKELVSDGFSYKDIAVITSNTEEYLSIIESVFERYDIPFFADVRESVLSSSFTSYVLSVFDCVATKEYRTENILRYIKSPLSGIDENDAAVLEEYVLKWGVDRDLWKSDFTGTVDETEEELYRINAIRRSAIAPLEKFKRSTKEKTADEICIALNELLNEIKLSDKTFGVIAKCSESDDSFLLKISRGFKQIWTQFLSAINSIYQNMSGEKITLKSFCELIKTVLASNSISNPPQSLDEVSVVNAQHSRLGPTKICFVMGLNDGVFPSTAHINSLITDKEREYLNDAGISIINSVSSRLERERLIAYIAVSTPLKRLVASYPLVNVKGESCNPSVLITDMLSMLSKNTLVFADKLPASFYCRSEKSAFYKYFDYLTKDPKKARSVRKELGKNPAMLKKLKFYDDLENNKQHKLSEDVAKNTFFSGDLNLSATRAQDYFECPFNYFCKNGLKIYPPSKIEISSLSRGNLIHFCLQELMCVKKDGRISFNEDFERFNDKEIKEKVHTLCMDFSERSFGGDFAKTKRFYNSLGRLEETVFYIVKNIISELEKSLFKPCAFEYDLTKKDNESLLKIKVREGVYISVRGRIDRVDIYDEGDKRYIKIVDYKTGGKSLKLEELYHGLNMQMVIYLLALISSDNEITKGKIPAAAGILYMPAKYIDNCLERTTVKDFKQELEKQLSLKREKDFKREGILVDNFISISAMDESLSGLYAPVMLNKDGSYNNKSALPMEQKLFDALGEFVKDKLIFMGESLLSGKIEAKPVESDDDFSCKYCAYWSVCGNYADKDPITVTKDDKKLLGIELEKIARRGEKDA